MFKLKQNGVSGNLCDTLKDFLDNRKQRIVLNGQVYFWLNVLEWACQGPTLGLLPLIILPWMIYRKVSPSSSSELFAMIAISQGPN